MSDSGSAYTRLTQQELVSGLRELVLRVRESGIRGARILIVGGAALQLGHFDRQLTYDIDARLEPADELLELARVIAAERSWAPDWLNNSAAQFIPAYGRTVDWIPLLRTDDIEVAVAPHEVLLAMKLRAARPGRDTADIARLMVLNHIDSVEAASELLSEFYPDDDLSDRALAQVQKILEVGLPTPSPSPELPDLAVL
ncbi:hypothetical protein GCM10028798_09110 [Humibacter antri]